MSDYFLTFLALVVRLEASWEQPMINPLVASNIESTESLVEMATRKVLRWNHGSLDSFEAETESDSH